MLPSLLPLLLLLVYSSQASQFLGTVMTYYPKNTNIDGSWMVVLRYKLNFHSCTQSESWGCLSGSCGMSDVVLRKVDEERSGEWCQREGIMTRQVFSNAPFQLVLDGSTWIDNIKNGISDWRAVTLVELRTRSDTGQANTSPQTTILPAVRVPSNCQRDFNLLAFDPDGDKVKCRYGSTSLSECNPCTPPSVLTLSSSCTLSFSPTSSSNEGPYAVQLVMEDFPRQTITLTQTNGSQQMKTVNDAISKIPVQFVLRVDPAVPSCTEGLYLPRFLPPTPANRAQLYTPHTNYNHYTNHTNYIHDSPNYPTTHNNHPQHQLHPPHKQQPPFQLLHNYPPQPTTTTTTQTNHHTNYNNHTNYNHHSPNNYPTTHNNHHYTNNNHTNYNSSNYNYPTNYNNHANYNHNSPNNYPATHNNDHYTNYNNPTNYNCFSNNNNPTNYNSHQYNNHTKYNHSSPNNYPATNNNDHYTNYNNPTNYNCFSNNNSYPTKHNSHQYNNHTNHNHTSIHNTYTHYNSKSATSKYN
ncbi:mucin-2-like protein [Lates japonicus]|uniref:Mucin-2-like protein n=1 Tax=Lates japonicus TaxID=270547 RepID=A0AAD3N8Y3_LATJO|nr:mucin-2-like protein [Lates japonicus]